MKAIVTGSLQDVMQQSGKSFSESFLDCDVILIVDTSGSMDTDDAPGGISRHDAAQKELELLQEQQPGKLAVVAFSSQVEFCPTGVPTRFNSSTNMAKALQFVKPADDCGIRFFLISDGCPANENDTLKIAKTFKSRIDVIYVGPEDGGYWSGREFLRKLAACTGGQYVKSAEIGMLAESVERLMLQG